MTDDTQAREAPDPPESGANRPGGTLGAVRATLARRDSKGRPVAVYGILGIAVATLLVLMLIVYFWSSDRDQPEQPICTSISPDRAEQGVRDGEVEQVVLGYDAGVEGTDDGRWGPVLAQLDYVDGQCATLPQGIANQADILSILGAIAFYNQTTERAQVEITYNAMTGLQPVLFTPPTAAPTATTPSTEAPETPVTTPAATPAVPPTPTPTNTPPISDAASPRATPRTDASTNARGLDGTTTSPPEPPTPTPTL